jgi:hypothetical protein
MKAQQDRGPDTPPDKKEKVNSFRKRKKATKLVKKIGSCLLLMPQSS